VPQHTFLAAIGQRPRSLAAPLTLAVLVLRLPARVVVGATRRPTPFNDRQDL